MLGMQRKLSTPFLVLLTLPATAMGFALSVQISVLSWILATEYGLDLHEIGLVWAAGPLAGIIGQLLIGVISDRVWFWGGRRRPFIVVGGILAALMILALPYIGVISQRLGLDAVLGVAIAVALALDLSINVSFNPTRSLITDVTPEGIARTRGYTWMQTVSGSFGVLAYAIGAIFGNYLLIYFAAGLVVVFSVVPALLIEEPRVLPGAQPATAEGPPDPAAVGLPAVRRGRDGTQARRHSSTRPLARSSLHRVRSRAVLADTYSPQPGRPVRTPGPRRFPQGAGRELAQLDRRADDVRLHDRIRAAALPRARRRQHRQGALDELPVAQRRGGGAAGAGAPAARAAL
jgi:MFS family permease